MSWFKGLDKAASVATEKEITLHGRICRPVGLSPMDLNLRKGLKQNEFDWTRGEFWVFSKPFLSLNRCRPTVSISSSPYAIFVWAKFDSCWRCRKSQRLCMWCCRNLCPLRSWRRLWCRCPTNRWRSEYKIELRKVWGPQNWQKNGQKYRKSRKCQIPIMRLVENKQLTDCRLWFLATRVLIKSTTCCGVKTSHTPSDARTMNSSCWLFKSRWWTSGLPKYLKKCDLQTRDFMWIYGDSIG